MNRARLSPTVQHWVTDADLVRASDIDGLKIFDPTAMQFDWQEVFLIGLEDVLRKAHPAPAWPDAHGWTAISSLLSRSLEGAPDDPFGLDPKLDRRLLIAAAGMMDPTVLGPCGDHVKALQAMLNLELGEPAPDAGASAKAARFAKRNLEVSTDRLQAASEAILVAIEACRCDETLLVAPRWRLSDFRTSLKGSGGAQLRRPSTLLGVAFFCALPGSRFGGGLEDLAAVQHMIGMAVSRHTAIIAPEDDDAVSQFDLGPAQ